MENKIKQYDIPPMTLWHKIQFFEQFRTYMSSSIPLTTSLQDIAKYCNDKLTRQVATLLLAELDSGINFCDAILKFKHTLGGVYCNLISLGAQSGNLPQILNDIYESLKRQRDIVYSIIRQCAYPAFLFFIIFIPAIAALLFFIVPRFCEYYKGLTGEIPAHLQAIQCFTQNLTHSWPLLLLLSALIFWGIGVGIKKFFTTRLGASFPLAGLLVRYYNLSLFSKLLAIGYAAGIPITHTILLAAESLPNKYIQTKLFKCASLVTRHSLTDTFAATELFPPQMLTKIKSGETSGELDKLLREISNDFDEALNVAIASLLQLIEPTLMLLMAGLIIFYGVTIVSTI